MTNQANREVLEAVAVTAEICGFPISDPAARVLVHELAAFPPSQVLGALKRCRLEITGRLTLAAIIQRLDDGRPGVEEAWAMYPRDEQSSAVITTEISEAISAVGPLMQEDLVAARMAFKEAYARVVARNRASGITPRWFVTLGFDQRSRADVLAEAAAKGRITAEQALMQAPTGYYAMVASKLGAAPALSVDRSAEVLALAAELASRKAAAPAPPSA